MKKSKLLSKEWRIDHLYKIVNKQGETIQFKMNSCQRVLFEKQKQMKEEWRPQRVMILKARQLWMTTYKLVEWYDRTIFAKNQTVIITAHNREKMEEIFQRVKFLHQNIPEKIEMVDGRVWEKPKALYDNKSELFFPSINSRIKIALDSRSGTPTSLPITELAFKESAQDMWNGTLPSVPENSPITLETTANGVWNFFYELWQNNYKKQSKFECLFFPWYDDKQYVSEEEFEPIEELKHLENLPITKQQKNWYYWKYQEHGRYVFQEYPSTPEEAFLSTGNPVLSQQLVKGYITNQLSYSKDWKYPELRIYKQPEKEKEYYFWVDTAGWWQLGDNSAITVRDKNYNLCATFYWKSTPDNLCEIIDRMYELGYRGIVGIERNNTGLATILKAKDYYWYSDLYSEKTIDKITNKSTKTYGWITSSKTRPIMISKLEELFRKEEVKQFDERELKEMFYFVYNEKNRPEAIQWEHDDFIISDCICLQMIELWHRNVYFR